MAMADAQITPRDRLIGTLRTPYEEEVRRLEDIVALLEEQPARSDRVALVKDFIALSALPEGGAETTKEKSSFSREETKAAVDGIVAMTEHNEFGCDIFHKDPPPSALEAAQAIERQIELVGSRFGRCGKVFWLVALMLTEHLPYADIPHVDVLDPEKVVAILADNPDRFAVLSAMLNGRIKGDFVGTMARWLAKQSGCGEDILVALIDYAIVKVAEKHREKRGTGAVVKISIPADFERDMAGIFKRPPSRQGRPN